MDKRITEIKTLSNASAFRPYQRNKIKHDEYIFLLCRNMFTQCDVFKILARRYLLQHRNVKSYGINFTILLNLSLKLKLLLFILCRYIIKASLP